MASPEERARALLEACGELVAPVDVEEVARRLELTIKRRLIEEKYSGFIDMDSKTIVVNAGLPMTRQRWYIAHAIGHYVLHRKKVKLVIDPVLMTRNGQQPDIVPSPK